MIQGSTEAVTLTVTALVPVGGLQQSKSNGFKYFKRSSDACLTRSLVKRCESESPVVKIALGNAAAQGEI